MVCLNIIYFQKKCNHANNKKKLHIHLQTIEDEIGLGSLIIKLNKKL